MKRTVRLGSLLAVLSLWSGLGVLAAVPDGSAPNPPIPIHFTLAKPGFVTLVIDDAQGRRVRNLVSETPFPAGANTVYWDGLDDTGRDPDAAAHAVYYIPGKLVPPGAYRVRGLVRDALSLRYQMAPYTHGDPPWDTPDKSGWWLANHTPPQAALFVPAAGKDRQPTVLVGSYVTEGGSGLAWLDLTGRKYHGEAWLGGVWTGAPFLARDAGDRPLPGIDAYAGAVWGGELRLTSLTAFGSQPLLTPPYAPSGGAGAGGAVKPEIGGLAVRNGLLAVSLAKSGRRQLLFVDALAHRALGTVPLEDGRGLAFDRQGRLLALSGHRLLRFTLPPDVRASAALPHSGWRATADENPADAPKALDADPHTRWSTRGGQAPGQWFSLDMAIPRVFSEVVLTAESARFTPRSVDVAVSQDGQIWQPLPSRAASSGGVTTVNFPRVTARCVRVTQTQTGPDRWFVNSLDVCDAPGPAAAAHYLDGGPAFGRALDRHGWTAASDLNPDQAARVLDGDSATRWQTGAPQRPGQTFRVDLGAPEAFTTVVLSCTGTDDYPDGFAAYVSQDGENWGQPVATGQGAEPNTVIHFPKVTARYLKVVQTGSRRNFWTISEINVYDDTGTTLPARPQPLPKAEVLATGLQDPQGITLDAPGDIYVSDWGTSHQVKVFAPSGRLLRTLGHPGAPQAGPYDPQHMNHPQGLTVDGQGRLWAAENDFQPKRLSVWDTRSGQLLDAFYGPPRYGGGGELDPDDPGVWYYDGMAFRLDWKSHTARPTDVFFREPDEASAVASDLDGPIWKTPQTPLHVGERLYLTNCYNSHPTNGASVAGLWRVGDDGVARPVAVAGQANDVAFFRTLSASPGAPTAALAARLPAGADPAQPTSKNSVFFLWTDRNGDGRMQPSEVTFQRLDSGGVDGVTVMPDLGLLVTNFGGQTVRLVPTRAPGQENPFYSLDSLQVLATGAQHPTTSGGGQALAGGDGWTVLTVAPKPFAPQGPGGVRGGDPIWSYPSLWPGLHASHIAPLPDHPGELIGTTRLVGGTVTPHGSDAGELWAVNGNKGNVYVFTTDGLFVATLFQDGRTAAWTFPQAVPDMPVGSASLHEEDFWPQWTQTPDGRVYLTAGDAYLIRVDGLDTIRRLPDADLTVTPANLWAAQDYSRQQEAARQQALTDSRQPLVVPILARPPSLEGPADNWGGAHWVTVDIRNNQQGDWGRTESRAQAALAVSGDRLYAAWRTGDPGLLRNAGGAMPLFTTGGGLDLMLDAVPGGERLLVTRVGNRTEAMLYQPQVVPGATGASAQFASPLRTLTFARVVDVSQAVYLTQDGRGGYEISVPLALLGLTPMHGRRLRGDIGILRGDGFETLQRAYWWDKATGLVSDIPTEAELTPQLWGEWEFRTL